MSTSLTLGRSAIIGIVFEGGLPANPVVVSNRKTMVKRISCELVDFMLVTSFIQY